MRRKIPLPSFCHKLPIRQDQFLTRRDGAGETERWQNLPPYCNEPERVPGGERRTCCSAFDVIVPQKSRARSERCLGFGGRTRCRPAAGKPGLVPPFGHLSPITLTSTRFGRPPSNTTDSCGRDLDFPFGIKQPLLDDSHDSAIAKPNGECKAPNVARHPRRRWILGAIDRELYALGE
jgi:hypothetical protein